MKEATGKKESCLKKEIYEIAKRSTRRSDGKCRFISGRSNLACTVFVPWDCHMNCPFCNTKKEYSTLEGIMPENTRIGIILVMNSTPYLNGDIREWVITGGEPLDNLDGLIDLVKFLPKDKPIFINTMIPKPLNATERRKLSSILKHVSGISVSRHFNNTLSDGDIAWLYNQGVSVRVNCVIEDSDCDDMETLKKKLSKHVNRYKNFCDSLNFRADYTGIRTVNDLKTLDNNVVKALCELYEYNGDGGCDVCNDNEFVLRKESFLIHYHRGLESTFIRLPNNQYVVNDVIIKPNGEVMLDWNMDLDEDLGLVAEYLRRPKGTDERMPDNANGARKPKLKFEEQKKKNSSKDRDSSSSSFISGGCGSVHSSGRPGGCGGDFDSSYACGRPHSIKVGCGWVTIGGGCSRGSCGGGC